MRAATVAGGRRSVNLTLDGSLVDAARRHGLNLSAIAETAIAAAVERLAEEQRAASIQRSIDNHHAHLAEHGSFATAVLLARASGAVDAD